MEKLNRHPAKFKLKPGKIGTLPTSTLLKNQACGKGDFQSWLDVKMLALNPAVWLEPPPQLAYIHHKKQVAWALSLPI